MKVENIFFHLRLCDILVWFVLIACLIVWLVIETIKNSQDYNIKLERGDDIMDFDYTKQNQILKDVMMSGCYCLKEALQCDKNHLYWRSNDYLAVYINNILLPLLGLINSEAEDFTSVTVYASNARICDVVNDSCADGFGDDQFTYLCNRACKFVLHLQPFPINANQEYFEKDSDDLMRAIRRLYSVVGLGEVFKVSVDFDKTLEVNHATLIIITNEVDLERAIAEYAINKEVDEYEY